MPSIALNILAELPADNVVTIRLVGMLAVLIGALVLGHLASHRFGLSEDWAKKIMTAVLVSFNWLIALFVIWKLNLSPRLAWLPLIGVAVTLLITTASALIFAIFKLERKTFLTLVLAGGLSNLGYTGSGFICYALFGASGLALANLYFLLAIPAAYLFFFPMLKTLQLRTTDSDARFKLVHFLDLRLLVFPSVVLALILNLANVRVPTFLSRLYIVDILVYVAAGLSFFAIGLRVNLSRLRNYMSLYFPLALIKFVLTPAVALLLICLLTLAGQSLTPFARNVIIVLSVSPSAVLVVTMSNVFDLNAPLASALWVVTMAIFAAIIVPILFLIFT